jgi:putative salt-induced outer membrane protein YdiY
MTRTKTLRGILAASITILVLATLVGCASTRPVPGSAGDGDLPREEISLRGGPRLEPDAHLVTTAPQEEGEEEEAPETKRWVFWFEAAASAFGGNTVARELDGRLEVKRVWESDEVSAFVRAEYGEGKNDDGETERNRNRQTASARYKHLFTDIVYGFAQQDLERDEFTDINLRSQTWLGAGARIYQDDHHELNGEISPGYVYTDYDNIDDEGDFSGRAAQDWEWKISEDWTFQESAELISNLEEIDEDFRTVAAADLRTELSKNIFLSFGVEHRYDSDPSIDDDGDRLKRQDWKAMIKVGIRF